MTAIELPSAPEDRKKLMTDILQKDEGCFVFTPQKIDLPEKLNLADVPLKDRPYVRRFLDLIASYLSKPIVIDRFETDEKGRAAWKKRMEEKWGEMFSYVYDKGRLRRLSLSIVLGSIETLIDPKGLSLDIDISQLELKKVKASLKPWPTTGKKEGHEPYAYLPLKEKLKIVDQVNQLAWKTLGKFIPSLTDKKLKPRVLDK